MPIVNRSCDDSQQKDVVHAPLGSVATGVTRHVAVVPYACTLDSLRYTAQGVSNAMQVALEVIRGAGSSGIAIGISNIVLQNRSVSGVVSVSILPAAGSTLRSLVAGDVLQVISSVANGNATDLTLELVLEKVQDIVQYNP
jgi:hypothetical protein